jgi:hypothetical protein
VVDLAQVEGLKQQARSRKQESALLILTIESVEFRHGGEWKQTERDRGTPIDPIQPVKELPRCRASRRSRKTGGDPAVGVMLEVDRK